MKTVPKISRNYKYNNGWRSLYLSAAELEELREQHREHTMQIMKDCILDARMILENGEQDRIACTLFESRVDKFFTWVMRALEDKTQNARANGGAPVTEERIYSSSSSGGD
ncbi:hypothetical protein BVY01_04440 [bacterium I07]|nr:hypothetical protein BVY01_04440 [bacterium I07]